jgi:hypothetical protein
MTYLILQATFLAGDDKVPFSMRLVQIQRFLL